jgi:tryptophan synthase beta chain
MNTPDVPKIIFMRNAYKHLKTLKVYLKREIFCTPALIKSTIRLTPTIARRMGKTRIIAETGAGQHGVATSHCLRALRHQMRIYMGAEDVKLPGSECGPHASARRQVVPVESGSKL